MKKISLSIFLFFSIFFFVSAKNCLAQTATFDPNYIADTDDFLNSTSMNPGEIQTLLASTGGFLANYYCQDLDGNTLRASDAIYKVAVTNQVNPRFILVLLEKEQSLISDPSPRQSQLDWATGYGCPDGGGCNERWRGFYKQINSASLQFRDYLENPQLYRYQAGQTYTISNTGRDPMTVTPINSATAALYNYTPHVYNGNYNFWKIWHKFFKQDGYPDGTLLQASGEPGIWLIQSGKKRPFLTWGAFISRFDPKKVIKVDKDVINKYTLGTPIKFPQYAIVKSPDNKLYLLSDDKKRLFSSDDAFKKIGYNPDEIIKATAEELAAYQDGVPITTSDVYPTGALLKDKNTGDIYWVQENTKAPVIDPIFLKTKFKNKKVVTVSADTLSKYQTIAPIKFDSGELVRLDGGFMNYVVEGLTLRPIASDKDFLALGYKWSNIITINPQVLLLYNIGDKLEASASTTAPLN